MITLKDLADELGIHQTPEQPHSGEDVLRAFDGTLPSGVTEVTDEQADHIRRAWRAADDTSRYRD